MFKKITLYTTLFGFFLSSTIVKAAGIVPKNSTGNYQLNDFVLLAANVSKLMLGTIGSIVLLMFIYGGFMMITAGNSLGTDNKTKINKGKNIITAALIGLLIVFTSFLIIKFILSSFGIYWGGKIAPLKQTSSLNITINAHG